MLVTDDRAVYERCIAYGFYERTGVQSRWNPADKQITDSALAEFAGVPLGGYKHRLNQTCSAMGRVQLRHYDARTAEIRKAMNRFWDLLEGVPGIKAHRPPKDSGSTMGGWYAARGLYDAKSSWRPADLRSSARRSRPKASARGPGPARICRCTCTRSFTPPTSSEWASRRWSRSASATCDRGLGLCRSRRASREIAFGIPWFKHDRPEIVKEYAAAYRKVAEHATDLV